MKLALVIPTYERVQKLKRLIDSIAEQTYKNFDVHIYCDNKDEETASSITEYIINKKYSFSVYVNVNQKRELVIGSWNKFFKAMFREYKDYNYDAVQWLVDDVELYPDFLEQVVNYMKYNFSDTDGVIGTNQICPGHPRYTFKWYGQACLGKKFIERYKDVDYQVCCPFYNHFFQDEEMFLFASKNRKFIEGRKAILKHYHPSFVREEKDTTHSIVRGDMQYQDKTTYLSRRGRNLLWGESFEK